MLKSYEIKVSATPEKIAEVEKVLVKKSFKEPVTIRDIYESFGQNIPENQLQNQNEEVDVNMAIFEIFEFVEGVDGPVVYTHGL